MNKPKHTPGPWTAKAYSRTNKCFVATSTGEIIFEQLARSTETISPDARLIASAPELLEALHGLIDFAEALAADGGRSADLREAYNAIAKATGGAE